MTIGFSFFVMSCVYHCVVMAKADDDDRSYLPNGFFQLTDVLPVQSKACQFKREISEKVLLNSGCANWAPINPAHFPISVNPAVGYAVIDLGHGVKVIYEGAYFLMVIETNTGKSILIDAPEGNWGPNPAFLVSALAASAQPVGTIVYSHNHLDHIGNAGGVIDAFGTTNVVCHELANVEIEKSFAEGDTRRRPCTTTFSGESNYTLTVGNQTLELAYYEPSGHGHGNIFIYHPVTKTLMLVDIVFPSWASFAYLALADNVPGYYADINRTLAYDFTTFVGGHLTKLGTRSDVETFDLYTRDVQQGAVLGLIGPKAPDFMQVAGTLKTFQPGTPDFLNLWLLFRVYLDKAALVCQDYVSRIWVPLSGGNKGRVIGPVTLSGVDVWARQTCWAAMESLRVDGNPPFNQVFNDKKKRSFEDIEETGKVVRERLTQAYEGGSRLAEEHVSPEIRYFASKAILNAQTYSQNMLHDFVNKKKD